MSAPKNLLVPLPLWQETLEIFQAYTVRQVEAGCFWYGTRTEHLGLASVLGIPRQLNRRANFEVKADDLAALTNNATASGLVVIAQLHLHPDTGVEHSPWDDQQIVSRNAYSIVIPRYASMPVTLHELGVHRFEEGEWRLLTPREAAASVHFIPTMVDTR